MRTQKEIIAACRCLLEAYRTGKLGQVRMPEDSNPGFSPSERERRLAYFTLPMSLNYQRDSYKLWEAALQTYNDPTTAEVFDIQAIATQEPETLKEKLLKHKLALQPHKHTTTWHAIATTIAQQWGSISGLLDAANHDFLQLQQLVQKEHKKGFPYLSGPKIFHYWSFIIQTYGKEKLHHADAIEIAPDTHITKCSVKLGVISETEAEKLTKEQISARWRTLLQGSGIDPIDMHPPLWFWSRNGFLYKPH